jgi:outer membrane receptor protein involved in Fe transport
MYLLCKVILKKKNILLVFSALLTFVAYAQKDTLQRSKKDTSDIEKMKVLEIKVQANIIENQADKLVYNASQDITSKGSSLSDMLSKVPMVEVDMDGNVSMRGNRNIKFLINGRPSGLLAGNLADALKSISADDIDKIEVITNPSAKYDAEGSGGVINIIMKDVRLKGNSSNFRMGLGTRSANLGGTFSVQRGKTNFTTMLGGHGWRTWGFSRANRLNTNQGITNQLTQNSDFSNWGGGPRVTFSVDHVFNKKNAFSASASLNTGWRGTLTDWETNVGIKDSFLNYLWNQNSDKLSSTIGYDLNVDYRRKFDKKDRELGWSAQFSNSTENAKYTSERKNQIGNLVHNEKSLNVGQNNELSTQIDFTEPLTSKISLESGLKGIWRFVFSDYTFDSLNIPQNEFSSIAFRNNSFTYYQYVYAGYSQVIYNLNSNYTLKIGGRFEHTNFGGNLSKPTESSFTGKPYNNFIPFLNISRKIGQGGYLRFNFTQRIQRPSLFYLNPYTNFSDPLNITTGNPYLSPEISTNYELSFGNYTPVGGYGINVYHKRLNNSIETYRIIDENRVYKTTYGNIGQNITTGFDVNINFKGKTWMLSLNGGAGFVNIRSIVDTGATAGLSTKGITYTVGSRGSYNISKNYTIEMFARFNAPTFSLQGYSANWFMHVISVKRRFKNDKGGIGLGLDNPFSPQVDYKTDNKGLNFSYFEMRRTTMWGVRINFDYAFGGVQVEKPKPVERKLKNDDLKDGEKEGGS